MKSKFGFITLLYLFVSHLSYAKVVRCEITFINSSTDEKYQINQVIINEFPTEVITTQKVRLIDSKNYELNFIDHANFQAVIELLDKSKPIQVCSYNGKCENGLTVAEKFEGSLSPVGGGIIKILTSKEKNPYYLFGNCHLDNTKGSAISDQDEKNLMDAYKKFKSPKQDDVNLKQPKLKNSRPID